MPNAGTPGPLSAFRFCMRCMLDYLVVNSPAKNGSSSSRNSSQLSKPVDAVTTLAGAGGLQSHRSDEISGTEEKARSNWATALQELWDTEPDEDDADSGEKGEWRTERVERADPRSQEMKGSQELCLFGQPDNASTSDRYPNKDKDDEIEKRGASPQQGSSTCSSDITRDTHVTGRPGTTCMRVHI